MVTVVVMVMVAILTRPTSACSLCHEERCAEDVVRGVQGRREGGGAFCLGWWWGGSVGKVEVWRG